MKSCCAEQFEEGIKEGGKRTFISLARSIDTILDKVNLYKALLAECFELLAKEEAKNKNVERLALLEKIRFTLRMNQEDKKHG